MIPNEFSVRTRLQAIANFKTDTFDFLIIGGGITGAAVARDAASRGLKVAVIDKHDFAWGTSSRSSKLIHGGLRYLESFEFGLVFEALAERGHLLKNIPYRVRPLNFYVPNYKGDAKGRFLIGTGLWLYDLLSFFHASKFHKHLSKKKLLTEIPTLTEKNLKGGYRYLDASMWDDLLVVDTLKAAHYEGGAQVANYVEALDPIWDGQVIRGFRARDLESNEEFDIRANRVIVCGGPWTDELGRKLDENWKNWLSPSKGVHIVFDSKKLPMPGAMVMVHPDDGRVSFVIGRPDMGPGLTIVGTTDGPTDSNPEKTTIEKSDVDYLMKMVTRYFPKLRLTAKDIVSAYVGVRPLMGRNPNDDNAEAGQKAKLQNVSREHYIGLGPGQVTLVAGGKYTTHRQMAEEIVSFALKAWENTAGQADHVPGNLKEPNTKFAANPQATDEAVAAMKVKLAQAGISLPQPLVERFGGDALEVTELGGGEDAIEGFPYLINQLRYALRKEMVIHIDDFFFRRVPLFMSLPDGGKALAETLVRVWAQELDHSPDVAEAEYKRLVSEIDKRSEWKNQM